jgi:hypothetical protein
MTLLSLVDVLPLIYTRDLEITTILCQSCKTLRDLITESSNESILKQISPQTPVPTVCNLLAFFGKREHCAASAIEVVIKCLKAMDERKDAITDVLIEKNLHAVLQDFHLCVFKNAEHRQLCHDLKEVYDRMKVVMCGVNDFDEVLEGTMFDDGLLFHAYRIAKLHSSNVEVAMQFATLIQVIVQVGPKFITSALCECDVLALFLRMMNMNHRSAVFVNHSSDVLRKVIWDAIYGNDTFGRIVLVWIKDVIEDNVISSPRVLTEYIYFISRVLHIQEHVKFGISINLVDSLVSLMERHLDENLHRQGFRAIELITYICTRSSQLRRVFGSDTARRIDAVVVNSLRSFPYNVQLNDSGASVLHQLLRIRDGI